jgi:hypothetical protein
MFAVVVQDAGLLFAFVDEPDRDGLQEVRRPRSPATTVMDWGAAEA